MTALVLRFAPEEPGRFELYAFSGGDDARLLDVLEREGAEAIGERCRVLAEEALTDLRRRCDRLAPADVLPTGDER